MKATERGAFRMTASLAHRIEAGFCFEAVSVARRSSVAPRSATVLLNVSGPGQASLRSKGLGRGGQRFEPLRVSKSRLVLSRKPTG